MKIGLLGDLPLGDLASTGSIEGTIDDQGNVVVPKDKFLLPQIGITDPVNIKVFMGIESDATGTFDEKTGKLVLNAKAGVWLSVNVAELLDALQGLGIDLSGQLGSLGSVVSGLGDLTCGFSPMDVSFSTDNEGGAPFTKESPDRAPSPRWSQLGPFAGKTKFLGFVDVCALIKQYAPTLLESLVGSQLPGGIDLGNLDIASLLDNLDNVNLGPSSLTLTRTKDDVVIPGPPATPDLKLSVKSSKKRIKAGKKAEFTVKVKNAGEAAATGVQDLHQVDRTGHRPGPALPDPRSGDGRSHPDPSFQGQGEQGQEEEREGQLLPQVIECHGQPDRHPHPDTALAA